MNPVLEKSARAIVPAVLGPALVGFALGARQDIVVGIQDAGVLPTIVVCTSALMLPALYIGAAFLGAAPRGGRLIQASVGALASTGIVLLGLLPALAFLISTATSRATVTQLGAAALTIAIVLGLRDLYHGGFDEGTSSRRRLPLFASWSLVTLGIGAHFISTYVS